MSALAEAYKFSVDEFIRLEQVGILEEHDRVELLEGEIIIMHAIGFRHGEAVTNLISEFMDQSQKRFALSPQNPVWLEESSLPQPDVALVPRNRRKRHHPKSDEVYLIVEVSDSSLAYDRGRKLPLYARFGVREYWIVNLIDDVIETYRDPEGDTYREVRVRRSGEILARQAFPDVLIAVDAIIPEHFEDEAQK